MDKKTVTALESHLGYLMRQVSNKVSGDFAIKMQNTGISIAEWVIMRIMFDHITMTHSEIVKKAGLTKGAITKTLSKLLEKDLIQKIDSKIDARSQMLSLSSTAKRKVPILAKLADANDAEYFSVLSRKEQQILKKILQKIIQAKGIKDIPTD